MLWTKNGSIPYETTDGTEGWQPAPDKPEAPEGKEVVWLNWEWVIRDPKPQDREGYQWNWQHDTRSWVEGSWGTVEVVEDQADPIVFIESFSTGQVANLTTAQLA
jgi:hypothetical protein